MVRAPFFDKNGMKKGAWSDEEDGKLKAYIEKNGHRNWRKLPKLAGLSRCGKSCRLRWVNYLRPQVKRGNYTSEEEDLIINLHRNHGSRWSMIAAKLPGRSDNEIKNHWHTHLRKRTMNLEPKKEKSVKNLSRLNEKTEVDQMVLADVCSKSSSTNNKQTSLKAYNGAYYMASNWSLLSNNESFEDFWTKPFFPDSSSDEYLAVSTNLVEYVSLSGDHDSFMVDSYLWSVMDLYGW